MNCTFQKKRTVLMLGTALIIGVITQHAALAQNKNIGGSRGQSMTGGGSAKQFRGRSMGNGFQSKQRVRQSQSFNQGNRKLRGNQLSGLTGQRRSQSGTQARTKNYGNINPQRGRSGKSQSRIPMYGKGQNRIQETQHDNLAKLRSGVRQSKSAMLNGNRAQQKGQMKTGSLNPKRKGFQLLPQQKKNASLPYQQKIGGITGLNPKLPKLNAGLPKAKNFPNLSGKVNFSGKPGQLIPQPWKHFKQNNQAGNAWKHKPNLKYFKGSLQNCLKRCHYVRHHHHLHWGYQNWCGYYPRPCHWWYSWCGPRYYFDPSCCVTFNWYYCPVRVVYRGVAQHFRWHLGVNCVYIPGRGLGIQDVEPGSPAELAGLAPGMVIMQADGRELDSETVMPSVLEESDGLLNLAVIQDDSEQVYDVAVQMNQLASIGR